MYKRQILDLGKFSQDNPHFQRFAKIVQDVQNEIKKNKNKGDIKIAELEELIKKIFNKLEIVDLRCV